MADAYGSSRTPVREAIVRLQQEGLVIIYPQARTNVSAISLDRISEEIFIRRSLELSMVDGFIKNCSILVSDTLENVNSIMRRTVNRQNILEFLATDIRFHRILFETAGQFLACDFIESSIAHSNRLRYLSIRHSGFDGQDIAEHDLILEAARQRDGGRMREVLAKHLREGGHRTQKLKEAYPAYFT